MNKKQAEKIEELIAVILALKSPEEGKKFLRDLMTEQELVEFANRWTAAQMLNDKIPYTTIEKETGLSSTTVARVSKWLTTGTGGYQLMLERLATKNHHPLSSRGKGLD